MEFLMTPPFIGSARTAETVKAEAAKSEARNMDVLNVLRMADFLCEAGSGS